MKRQQKKRIPGKKVRFFILLSTSFLLFFSSCQKVQDWIRAYGVTERQKKVKKLREHDIEMWKRDLGMSRERVEKLHADIHSTVQESNYQGILSWKIAKAYAEEARYEMAAEYYEAALEERAPVGEHTSAYYLEQAIPFYEEALKRHLPDPELLFDAGLCYANASKNLGWERSRWQIAVLLFQRLHEMKPDDIRAPYQLALLYGMAGKPKLRDTDRALALLDENLRREPNDVPSRFLMAHLYALIGNFERAKHEYEQIITVIEDLHATGQLGGPATNNPQYKKARENIEQLDACIAGSNQCDILR